jgi:ABC-type sugar transport system ATPase subunit
MAGMTPPPGKPNTFLNFDNLIDGIATPMSYYAIMAVGLTIVIITGGIDISVGPIMALSALGGAAALQALPENSSALVVLPIAILAPLIIGLICGAINGALIVSLALHPFIVTLGTMSIFRGLANVLPPEKTLPAAGKHLPVAFTTNFMRVEVFGLQPMPLIIMLLCVAIGWFYLRMMFAGRETCAIGGNEEAARFSGLRVGWSCIIGMPCRANISLALLDRLRRAGVLDRKQEKKIATQYFNQLRVKAASLEAPVNSLSGGNQQKIVLAKWLARGGKLLIVDEPTRGVDVGAKAAIHALIDNLARQGLAVMLISSELPELLNLSNRILVMRGGRPVGELSREQASQEAVLRLMAGVGSARAA